MPKAIIEKIEFFSVVKDFEAKSVEEALEMARTDESADWQSVNDDSVVFFWAEV